MNNSASRLNPQQIGALVGLVNQSRLTEAEGHARKFLVEHPDEGMLWKILSVALVRQGKDALTALRRTTELMPGDSEAHRNLAAAWQDRGQWTEALVSLHRALEIDPHDADAFADAADAMRALGRVRDAVPLYERALLLDPRLAEAQNNLGNAFLELGRFDDAIGCYRRALQMKPDNAQILCNLGNAHRQLRQMDDALSSSRRAVALDPNLTVAHNNLGLILMDSGRRDEAVACYRRALSLNPKYVSAHNNLGNALRELGLRREAIFCYSKAIELDPACAESRCNLGTVLFEIRQVDEAVANFREALVLQPDYAPAHLSLGLALRQQRRPAEAEASCQAALSVDPNYVEALAFLGELHADRGQFLEAEELFKRAITANPDFASAYSSIATHRKMTSEDTVWLERAEALLGKHLPLTQEIVLRYALGKYFDDVSRYDTAFEHYRSANELTKNYGAKYEPAKFARLVDRLIRDSDSTFMRQSRAQASTSELPIFIVGMPRSGTSLAEQILASHPGVFGAGEVTFWNGAYHAYRGAELGKASPDLLAGLARDYLDRLTSMSDQAQVGGGAAPRVAGVQRVVDKLPANFLYAGLIHAALPRARIIHMRRHPIDTCLSIYFQNFFNIGPYANDLHDLAHYYGEYIRITDHWRAVLPATSLLEIPYEALLDDPEGWTRRMLDFVGLPWDPKCLDFHQTDRVVITASKWQVRQKITKSSAGRWRNYERFIGPLRGLL